MREYKKIIIMSAVLLILIVLIVLAMIFDVDFLLFKNLSIAGIGKTKNDVETLIGQEETEEQNLITAKDNLAKAKTNFEEAKTTYENIDEATIATVQEATKTEEYFIEYLWVTLGNYADAANLDLHVVDSDSVSGKSETITSGNTNITVTTPTGDTVNSNNTQNTESTNSNNLIVSVKDGSTKIIVIGRYADVADFVFDVENDKSLRFKLDNISMTYLYDTVNSSEAMNKIVATFDVLSLNVKK